MKKEETVDVSMAKQTEDQKKAPKVKQTGSFYDESRSRWIITTENILKSAESISNILQGIDVHEYPVKFILIGKTGGFTIAVTNEDKFVLLRSNRELI